MSVSLTTLPFFTTAHSPSSSSGSGSGSTTFLLSFFPFLVCCCCCCCCWFLCSFLDWVVSVFVSSFWGFSCLFFFSFLVLFSVFWVVSCGWETCWTGSGWVTLFEAWFTFVWVCEGVSCETLFCVVVVEVTGGI